MLIVIVIFIRNFFLWFGVIRRFFVVFRGIVFVAEILMCLGREAYFIVICFFEFIVLYFLLEKG